MPSSFDSFGLHPLLLEAIEDLGFAEPTPIQTDVIPPAMVGRDVLATAETGSGKTAAFLLPILHQLMEEERGKTRALVLTPTRELAVQTVEHHQALAAHTDLSAASVIGGVAMGPQRDAFRRGVDVLVATPGRLLDHMRNRYASLDSLEFLVIDEADRMLDMGFLPDINRILDRLPGDRQNLLLSATLPAVIVSLADRMLRDPVRFNLARGAEPAHGITHAVYRVRESLKRSLLLEMLRRGKMDNVLVFTRTKNRAERLAGFLERNGISCDVIHGDRTQAQRTEALHRFKESRRGILVATDIAARGLDIAGISHVVNFDVPEAPEDYVHRVGRTARAEATGDAFTLVSGRDLAHIHAIEDALGERLPRIELEGFDYEGEPEDRGLVSIADRIAAARKRKGSGSAGGSGRAGGGAGSGPGGRGRKRRKRRGGKGDSGDRSSSSDGPARGGGRRSAGE